MIVLRPYPNHVGLFASGETLTSDDLGEMIVLDEINVSRCVACEAWKDISEFGEGQRTCRTCSYDSYYYWILRNRDKKRAAQQRYRTRKHETSPKSGAYTRDELWDLQSGICAICFNHMEHFDNEVGPKGTNRKRATVDHIVPLSRGGTDCLSNVQMVCWSCNSKKGNNL